MNITILGATGLLGRHLVMQALGRGHRIRVLARDLANLGALTYKVEVVLGDVFDERPLEEAVRGADAVLSAVDPPKYGPIDPALYRQGMQSIVSVLDRQSVRRYIHTGGAVHPGGENEVWSPGRRFLQLFLNLVARPVLTAKSWDWEVLKASNLDWTLVRLPRIREDGATGRIAADARRLARTQINVDDLAGFMLDQVSEPTWIRLAPLVASIPAPG